MSTRSSPSPTGCRALEWIVVLDRSAMFAYAHPKLSAMTRCCAPAEPADLAWLEQQAAQLEPGAPAFIVYTSGTTGHPKGALVTHGKHLAATANRRRRTIRRCAEKAAPHRRLPAAVPRARPRRRRDAAADLAARAAFRRERGGPAGDLVRDGADRAVHGAALPAEVRRAGAGRDPQLHRRQARRLRSRHGVRARARAGGAGTARPGCCSERSIAPAAPACSGRSSTRSASTGWSWWSAAARRCRPRPWRCGTCSASTWCEMYGQTETAGGIISGQRGPFPRPGDVGTVPDGCEVKLADGRRDAGAQPRPVRGLLEQRGGDRARSWAPTAGCAPATSANGATARCG